MSRLHALALQTHRYEDIESSMCTGDIILFDSEPPAVRWAEWLAHALALLPCSTYAVVRYGRAAPSGGDEEVAPVEREWHHWRCAALVVRMIDETETNPHHDSAKQIPYVFCVLGDSQCHSLWPLKSLLAQVGGRYFALRQLLTASDKQHQRLSTQLRNSLRGQILKFYQETLVSATAELQQCVSAAFEQRWRAVRAAIERAGAPLDAKPGALARQRNALYRASSAYFTLYTLYQINVLRCEPSAATAVEALQEGGYVEQQLSRDYFLGDELVFHYR